MGSGLFLKVQGGFLNRHQLLKQVWLGCQMGVVVKIGATGFSNRGGEVCGICYGVKRGSASRSGTSPNPQTPTQNLTPIKNTNHMF